MIDASVLQFCLVGGLNLWLAFLWSSSGSFGSFFGSFRGSCRCCTFVCLGRLCGCCPLVCLGLLRVLLHVWLRVPVHVETICAIGLEEELFKVLLKLSLGDRRKKGNLLLLPIEIVLMSRKLLGPIPGEFLPQILVFLRDGRVDGANVSGKVLVRQTGHLFSHLCQVHIKSRPYVHAILGRRLNQEPCAHNVTHRSRSRKHHVPKLLFRSQLVKCGLLEILQRNLIQ